MTSDADMNLVLQLFGPNAATAREPLTGETVALINAAGIEAVSGLPDHPAGLLGALSLLTEEESESRGRELARKCRDAIRAQLTDMEEDQAELEKKRATLTGTIGRLQEEEAEIRSRLER